MFFPDRKSLPDLVSGKARQHAQELKQLRKAKPKAIDGAFHAAHEDAFAQFDCLTCANCCKTTSPVFTDQDIARISRKLRMRPAVFTETYLQLDDESDYVLREAPCPFLLDDNACMIYEVRPKACRSYPHTDMVGMRKRLKLTLKNTEICPATHAIWQRVAEELG